jgi:hypothetical protein
VIWFRRDVRRRQQAQQLEADAALQSAINSLHESHLKREQVRGIGERLRELQRRNHYAENVAAIYLGRNR